MRQLVYDDDFKEIVSEKIKYWQNASDIPKKVKDYITNISNELIFRTYNDEYGYKDYCSNCLKELDVNHYCEHCQKSYTNANKKYIVYLRQQYMSDMKYTSSYTYVFDVVDDEVVLYNIENKLNYDHLAPLKYKESTFSIASIYDVKKDSLYERIEGHPLEYSKIEEFFNNPEAGEKITDIYVEFCLPNDNQFLYVDNLDELKKSSLYKYSQIWQLKNKFNNNDITLSSLTYNPICCKEFEYLIKMQLYNLAISCSEMNFGKGKNFKDIFGIDKKYYKFMKDIDITNKQYDLLKMYPTTDFDLLNFIAKDKYSLEMLKEYVKLEDLKKYIESQEDSEDHIRKYISDYYDYINGLIMLGADLKDKKVLYPKNFYEEHDRVSAEVMIVENPDLDQKIHDLSNVLSLNVYENDEYIIFPADSISSMIDESSQQQNCVRTYCERVGKNDCQIYFMRNKNAKDKSLVTVEVRDGKVVQARTKFNKDIDSRQRKFLSDWEKVMIPIIKGDN